MSFTKWRKNGGREREARARERQHETAAKGGKVKALEDGLEHKPLTHETGSWRHRSKAHRGEQRANRAANGSRLWHRRYDSRRLPFSSVRSEEERPFGQRVACEMEERDDPGETGQIVEMIRPEDQRGAQRDDGDRGVLGGRESEQRSPVVLLERIKDGENCAERRHDDSDHG